LAQAAAANGVTVTGRNPLANKATVLGELRKACIAELTAQQFDAFGALATDSGGRPQLNLFRTSQQGKYIRFFEQAFEWDHLVYFFYPYFWADKATWQFRSLLDDLDGPDFADFLRAGAARVVFPVRPGFEQAVLHFPDTGLTWDDFKVICMHQVAMSYLEAAREAAGIPAGPVMVSLPAHGNLAAATLPLQLAHALEQGRCGPGDKVAMLGLAGGVSLGVFFMEL